MIIKTKLKIVGAVGITEKKERVMQKIGCKEQEERKKYIS